MKLELKRIYNGPKYCIGHLYVDGEYFCDTIEDTDRGLDQTMPIAEIKKKKVYAETAIPTGLYTVIMNVQSGTFKKKQFYWDSCRGFLPRLLNVPGYDGVLIHCGSTEKSTAGCLIVGFNKVKGRVVNSQAAWEALYNTLKSTKTVIRIYITRNYKV